MEILSGEEEGRWNEDCFCMHISYIHKLSARVCLFAFLTTGISFLHFKLLILSTAEITKIGPTFIGRQPPV